MLTYNGGEFKNDNRMSLKQYNGLKTGFQPPKRLTRMKSAQPRPQILVMDSQLVGDGPPSAISVTNLQESESKQNTAAEIFHQTFGSGVQSAKERNKRPISSQSHISNFVTATK